jgi:hypothetical protein
MPIRSFSLYDYGMEFIQLRVITDINEPHNTTNKSNLEHS